MRRTEPPAKYKDGRTALYRHLSETEVLLYVGISLSAVQRLQQHKSRSWFPDIARIEIEYFDTRTEALRAERAAINTQFPIFNDLPSGRPICFGIKEIETGLIDGWYGDRWGGWEWALDSLLYFRQSRKEFTHRLFARTADDAPELHDNVFLGCALRGVV